MTARGGFLDFLAVSAVGLLAFLAYADKAILHPFNIAWIRRGDPVQHLDGLLYFIREPWTLPVGSLSSYGEGFSTSVVYTDSIPLFAIALKLLVTLTRSSHMFQPFGVWFLLCFILQAWFAFRLATLFVSERSTCVLIGFLTCLSPPFLIRGFGHESLMAHWLIIWALLLSLDPNGQIRALATSWPLLLVVSLGVHPYIFFICTALCAAANLRVLLLRPSPWRRVMLSAGCTIASVLAFAYLFGYFMHVVTARSGYQHYKMNVLAPINPMGWSIVLPSFRDMTGGEYEGFSYFGLGILILILIASLQRASAPSFFLGDKIMFISLLVLCAVALTPYLHIGALRRRTSLGLLVAGALVLAYGLFPIRVIPGTGALRRHMWRPIVSLIAFLVGAGLAAVVLVPLIPEEVLSLVRSTGRLFWPAWYFFVFLSCIVLARAMVWRRVCILLVGCALVQVVDLSPGLARINRDHFSAHSPGRAVFVSQHLTDTLTRALVGKRRLSILADGPMPPGWEQLTFLALRTNVGIDKASYARLAVGYEAAATARLREVLDGLLRDDTVYLVYPNYRDRVDSGRAQLRSGVSRSEVDGYLVLWSEGN
jgi:uncharacterized protein DUF6311